MPDRPRRERPERKRVAPPRASTASARKPAASRSKARPVGPKPRPATPKRNRHPQRVARPTAAPKQSAGPKPGAARRPKSPGVRRRRSVLVTLLAGLLLLGFLFVFVYPTRTYLKQREQIQASQQRLDVLDHETATLERDTRLLGGDAEIERIAREQYGLVRPGETPYVLVPETTPEPTPQPTTPTTAPDRKQPAGK